jgi:hypothetical protein
LGYWKSAGFVDDEFWQVDRPGPVGNLAQYCLSLAATEKTEAIPAKHPGHATGALCPPKPINGNMQMKTAELN